MSLSLLLSIYNKPWLIDRNAAQAAFMVWQQAINSNDFSTPLYSKTLDVQPLMAVDNSVIISPSSRSAAENFKGFDGSRVAVIPVSGLMMKQDGFCGELGTAAIANYVTQAANTPSVEAIVIAMDSPGGTVDGTEALHNAIKNASTISGKRTICSVSGMMGSAGYWSGSACNEIYASGMLDTFGSIGTMCSLMDNSKAMRDKGLVVRDYFATDSQDKNRAYIDAKNGNGAKLITDILDPINEVFTSSVKMNRAGKLRLDVEDTLTGKTYNSVKAIEYGLADGIKPLQTIVQELMQATPATQKTQANKNNNNMTISELKAQHPDLVQAISAEAVAAEKVRVSGYLNFIETDPKAVTDGIKGNEPISTEQTQELMMKKLTAQMLPSMQAQNQTAPTNEMPIVANSVKGVEEGSNTGFSGAAERLAAKMKAGTTVL